jgi:RNA polymerase sigma-70 factor (ECF subfamily)
VGWDVAAPKKRVGPTLSARNRGQRFICHNAISPPSGVVTTLRHPAGPSRGASRTDASSSTARAVASATEPTSTYGSHSARLVPHPALQDALLRAWRGLPQFEGRSLLRSWLYRIATNSCLRLIERRPKRVLPIDYGPPSEAHDDPAPPLVESVWVEPYPDAAVGNGFAAPEARYEHRESIELAFVAALQHLPARQRAVLILRDVLGFSGEEVADTLETTPKAVYSALQRAHQTVDQQLPALSQQQTLSSLGDARVREIVKIYVDAWERGDVDVIVSMLAKEAILAMPPRPSWYLGRDAARAFLARGPLAPRILRRGHPAHANGQRPASCTSGTRTSPRPCRFFSCSRSTDMDASLRSPRSSAPS